MNIRIRLKRAVDRFPHFLAEEGLVGTLVDFDQEYASIKMDHPLENAEEWDNCICYYAVNGDLFEQVSEDVETLDGNPLTKEMIHAGQ